MRLNLILVVSSALLLIARTPSSAQITFVDGGVPLPGFVVSAGINNTGQAYINCGSQLFRDTNGTVTVLTPPPGIGGLQTWYINDSGAIGAEGSMGGSSRALIRRPDGSYLTIPGSGSLRGTGINNSADGVGWVEGSHPRAYLYRASDASFNLLPEPAGSTSMSAYNQNNTRIVTGIVSLSGNPSRVFRYDADAGGGGGSVQVIPTGSSEPTDINDAGVVVGAVSPVLPFRWNADGSVTLLPSIGTGVANGINNSNEIVGNIAPSGLHAAYWSPAGVLTDLNDLLTPAQQFNWTLRNAWDINDAHTIVGQGFFDPDGAPGPSPAEQRLFFMTVPEPSVIGVVSLFALCLMRRRLA